MNRDLGIPDRAFVPREVLFASTTDCNRSCRHCSVIRDRSRISPAAAVKFLKSCRNAGIERIGFTGGEPFLDPEFLHAVTRAGIRMDFLFDRITTNASWFGSRGHLRRTLEALHDSGYDGSFGVSVDAFHAKTAMKQALFIETAAEIWNRPDVASVIAVKGAQDERTEALLEHLAEILAAAIIERNRRRFIKNAFLIIPMTTIEIVPVGRAGRLAEPWGREWFKEDFCRGPGHVFYVQPDGSVKPCCGYATEAGQLSIGNIHTDSAGRLLKNAAQNPFVTSIYHIGLTGIRRRLTEQGIVFPGGTKNHCFFCHYILTRIPPRALHNALADSVRNPGRKPV